MKISQIMSREVVSAHEGDTLGMALKQLDRHAINHLPVLGRGGKLVGIVSDRDLKRASASDATLWEVHELRYLLDKVKLSEVMTKNPLAVTSKTSIQSAAKLAAENKLGCLPVVDGDELVGIVTNRDFLHHLAAQKSA